MLRRRAVVVTSVVKRKRSGVSLAVENAGAGGLIAARRGMKSMTLEVTSFKTLLAGPGSS